MHLLPVPKKITCTGAATFSATFVKIARHDEQDMLPAKQLAEEWAKASSARAVVDGLGDAHAAILRMQQDQTLPHEAYRLVITEHQISLTGGSSAGVYYGAQTLRQIIRQCGDSLPCLDIEDAPDYAVRGFYHDVSRGKVPSRDTLLALIEKLAHYKINHFQLYIEHPYAFRDHPEIWAGSDPLTSDDIQALQDHCLQYHVEFVPSLSTFGHCYRLIRNHRNQHLNELPLDAAARPFSFRDAMTHYTLDCSNPAAVRLMRGLIREYGELFSARYFNLCCDETFDLGKGKNADAAGRPDGVGALYAGYLREMMAEVQSLQKTPMLWADILLNHREQLPSIPADSVLLHWDYSPNPSEEKCRFLHETGRAYYVCSGVDGWRKCFNDLNGASWNILRMARLGMAYGAGGFLNTDWGDIGHINFLSSSYHGLVAGAAWSWRVPKKEERDEDVQQAMDSAFALLEVGDSSGESVALMREVSRLQLIRWGEISLWRDPSPDIPAAWRDSETGFPSAVMSLSGDELLDAFNRLTELRGKLEGRIGEWCAQDEWHVDELLCSIDGVLAMLHTGMAMQALRGRAPDASAMVCGCADRLRHYERRLSVLWHRRNRPSEYYRLRMDLLGAAEKLDAMAIRSESD